MVHLCRCRVKNWALSSLSSFNSVPVHRFEVHLIFCSILPFVPRRLKMVHSCRFPQVNCPSGLSISPSQSASNLHVPLLWYVFDHFPILKQSIQPALKWLTRFENRASKSLPFVHFHRIHLKHFEDLEILPYLVYPCAIQSYPDRFWSKIVHFSRYFFFLFSFFGFSTFGFSIFFEFFFFLDFPIFFRFPYHDESIKFLQGSGGE